MAKNYSNKKKSAGRVVAGVLCGVLLVAAVAGAGTSLYMGAKNNGWFDSEDDIEVTESTDESSIDNVVISEGASTSKLSISSSRTVSLTAASYTTASSYTLTAIYNEDATSPEFTWTSSDTTSITLTPSADTITCTVTCNAAFSKQITITCTSVENTSLSATCTVDYVCRMRDGGTVAIWNDYTDSMTPVSTKVTLAIPNDYWNDSYSDTNSKYKSNKLSVYSASPNVDTTGTVADTYTSTVTWSYCGSSGTMYSDTGTYEDLCFGYLLGAKAVELGYTSSYADLGWITNSTYRNYVYYEMLIDYANGEGVTITAKYKGEATGETQTVTMTLLLDVSELYNAVTSVELQTSAIYF